MQQKKSIFALVLVVALVALTVAPAGAQVIRGYWVTEVGAGPTYDAAYDDAYAQLQDHGIVMAGTVSVLSSHCHETPLGITLCDVKLRARILPGPVFP